MKFNINLTNRKANFIIGLSFFWIAIVFYYFINNQILPYTNRFDDEGYYLRDSITIWSKIKEFGFFEVITQYLKQNLSFFYFEPGPSTNLGFLAALFMCLGDPGRMSALTVNLIALIVGLLSSAKIIKKITDNNSLQLVPIIFLFLSCFCFNGAGDSFDFRLDFFGSCIYGIAICGLIFVLNQPSVSIFKSFVALFPIFLCSVFRFIIIVYLILPVFYFVISLFKNKRQYFKNILCSLSLVFLLVMTQGIWGYTFLRNYYWLQQQSSLEKLFRQQYSSELSQLGYFFYYPKIFLSSYLGYELVLGLIYLFIFLYLKYTKRSFSIFEVFSFDKSSIMMLTFLSILSPLIILSLNYVRTAQVVGVLFIPFCIFSALIFNAFEISKNGRLMFKNISLFFLILGILVWPVRLFQNRKVDLSEMPRLNAVFESAFLHFKSDLKLREKPIVAFLDVLTDVDQNTFTIWAAERKGGTLLLPDMVISRLPFNMPQEKILKELSRANYFIVPKEWSHLNDSKWLIFHDVLKARRPILFWIEKNTNCKGTFKWKDNEYYTCFRGA